MNLPPSAAEPTPPSSSPALAPAPRRNWPRLLVNAAVTLVVIAVAAATFVLSYSGVHAIALQGGVSGQLARIYPGVFDAVLVIACVAAVVLRDGRWWARCWAWLVVIVVLGAIGTTDVLHAANYALRQRPTEGVVAAAPVAGVLLAFSLLLTMLRQARPLASGAAPSARGRAARRAAGQSAAPAVATPIDATPIDATRVDLVPVVAAGAVPRSPAPPIALPPAPAEAAQPPAQPPAETLEIPAYPGDAGEATDAGEAADAGQGLPEAVAAPETVEAPDVPATPDVQAAADAVEDEDEGGPAAEPLPQPTQPTQPTQALRPAPQAIRYASSAAAEDWESEVDPDLAGQVYPVLTSDPDIDTSGYPDEPQNVDDDDAPPFATAPFASVPRLNRMRVTPIPPTDTDADDD